MQVYIQNDFGLFCIIPNTRIIHTYCNVLKANCIWVGMTLKCLMSSLTLFLLFIFYLQDFLLFGVGLRISCCVDVHGQGNISILAHADIDVVLSPLWSTKWTRVLARVLYIWDILTPKDPTENFNFRSF